MTSNPMRSGDEWKDVLRITELKISQRFERGHYRERKQHEQSWNSV